MAARHRPFRESKVEKDRREAKEREEELASKALTRPMELRSARPAATSMEFVLTSMTPGASGLVSAEELSRISLEFATKVEEAKILWDMIQTAPHELCLATERPAKFNKAVEVMKQMAQDAHAASQAREQMVQEPLAASQPVPKQPG